MQPQQIDKIKNLITISPLLNEGERQEWLSLLELMNDKQVLELEKILNSAVPMVKPAPKPVIPPAQTPHPGLSLGVASQPHAAPATSQPAKPAAPLHLSHILNIPTGPNLKTATPVATPGKVAAPATTLPFEEKLHHTLSEKELPEGKALPEISEHGSAGKPAGPAQAIIKPIPPATAPKNPPVSSPPPFKPNLPPIPQPPKPAQAHAQTVHLPEKKPDVPPGVQQAPAPATIQPAPAKPLPRHPVSEPEAVFTPGLNNPKLILNAQLAQTNKPKPATIQSQPVVAAPEVGHQQSMLPLKDLESLQHLSVRDWKYPYMQSFLQQLQKLIKQFGYHDVIFNFEKSLLFQAYINTGLAVLKQQVDFSELQNGSSLKEAFLSREDFEALADVLHQLPVSA